MPAKWLGWPLLAATLLGCAPGSGVPDVLLITLDTTRADHLGCYGYARDTSPNLDRLAAESTLYTRAYSTSSWTLPAHASLFTAKWTVSHGARYDPNGPLALSNGLAGPEGWSLYRARGLARGQPTLASVLREAGHATGAVVGGPWLKRIFGLDAGFEHYDDDGIDEMNGRRAADVTDRAITWVDQQADRPFLLFLNYYDPHAPYAPPDAFRGAFVPADASHPGTEVPATPRDLYDAEILYADHHIGRLLAHLRAIGRYENTWIVVTADHGELFGEHGLRGHGKHLTEPEIRVPLLVKRPGPNPRGRRVDAPIQLTEIAPLVLREFALPRALDSARIAGDAHPIVAELYPWREERGTVRVLIEGPFKFTWNERGAPRLFNLARDPSETRDIRGRDPERAEAMEARLNAYLADAPRPGPAGPANELDAETQRALRNLGYLE